MTSFLDLVNNHSNNNFNNPNNNPNNNIKFLSTISLLNYYILRQIQDTLLPRLLVHQPAQLLRPLINLHFPRSKSNLNFILF